jgi:tetratricopeptide (TPR) repeat protein
MIAVKQIKEAREACNELFDIATKLETPYLNGMSAYCQGAVFLAEGNIQHALEHLKNAIKVWDILNLPYETARTKELKGLVYRELNDKDTQRSWLSMATPGMSPACTTRRCGLTSRNRGNASRVLQSMSRS